MALASSSQRCSSSSSSSASTRQQQLCSKSLSAPLPAAFRAVGAPVASSTRASQWQPATGPVSGGGRDAVVAGAAPAAVTVIDLLQQQQHQQQQQQKQQQQQPRPSRWMEQAIPALVRHLSLEARGDPHSPSRSNAWLQVVRAAPAPSPQHHQHQHHHSSSNHRHHQHHQAHGGVTMEHKRLAPFTPSTAAEVWREVYATQHLGAGDALAVVVARPIPDPTHLCPLTSPAAASSSSSTSSSSAAVPAAPSACASSGAAPASAQQAAAPPSQVQMKGLVDLDNCCGGTPPSPSSSAAACPAPAPAAAGAGVRGAQLRSLARRMVGADVSNLAPRGSNSSSSSDEEEQQVPPIMAMVATSHKQQQQQQPHGHHHHGHHSHHTSKSRRRFLRRQLHQQHSHSHDHHSQDGQQQQHAHGGSSSSSSSSGSQPETLYYGLAVQSLPDATHAYGAGASSSWDEQQQQQPNGCYVLKLSRNQDAYGCSCTVFTVTHVCRGQPLYQQLVSSWIATPNGSGGSGSPFSEAFA